MPNEIRKISKGPFNISVTFDKESAAPVELMIYQDIGDDPWGGEGFTAQDFIDATKDIDRNRPIKFRVNSAGGLVWEGQTIKTLADEWPGEKSASIDGMAASVASWMFCSPNIKMSAARHAQMFIHDAWGMCMGNSADMEAQAKDLDKTSDQIAGIYQRKAGGTVQEWRNRMKANSLFTAEEANKLGLIDSITDDEPVSNFSAIQVRNMKAKLATLNQLKQTPADGGNNQKKNNMSRAKKIALLNKWGFSVPKDINDELLNKLYDTAKTKNETCKSDEEEMKNAPEPSAEKPDADSDDTKAPGKEGELFKAATENQLKATEKLNKFLAGSGNKKCVHLVDR